MKTTYNKNKSCETNRNEFNKICLQHKDYYTQNVNK